MSKLTERVGAQIDLRRGYMSAPGVPPRRRRYYEFPNVPPYNEEMGGRPLLLGLLPTFIEMQRSCAGSVLITIEMQRPFAHPLWKEGLVLWRNK